MAKEVKLLEDWPEFDLVCGIDEVGKGSGAGPVVTAAVIMPRGFKSPLIRDSKKLSPSKRNEAYKIIVENAISIACNAGSVKDINEIGINPTIFKTMHRCIDELSVKPQYILVDGNVWQPYTGTNADNNQPSLIPKGDDKYICIAAAAIVAKVRRDEYMDKLHVLYPQFNWTGNKGYLTPDHIAAIKEYGSNKYHRTLYIRNFV